MLLNTKNKKKTKIDILFFNTNEKNKNVYIGRFEFFYAPPSGRVASIIGQNVRTLLAPRKCFVDVFSQSRHAEL